MKTQTSQQGAILIICLLFMLIMTVLGTSSMQRLTLGERMTANLWDVNLALQSAEAALRAGEQLIVNGWGNSTPTNEQWNDAAITGLSSTRFGHNEFPHMSEQSQDFWDAVQEGLQVDVPNNTDTNPVHVIHYVTLVPQSLARNQNSPIDFFYLVTAQSPGRSDVTQVVLQKMVQKQGRVSFQ